MASLKDLIRYTRRPGEIASKSSAKGLGTALAGTGLAGLFASGQQPPNLREQANALLNKRYDPAGLEAMTGVAPPTRYGDILQTVAGLSDIYAPLAAAEAVDYAREGDWKNAGLSALGAVPMFGGAAGVIKASHGTPHAFTKFDLGRIGTGAGTQAYGHGLYFAEGFDSPVAKGYQKLNDQGVSAIANKFLTNWGNKEIAAEKLAQLINLKKPDFSESHIKPYEDALELIRKNEQISPEGYLYNVDLKWPDPAREAADPLGEHHLLDWDAQVNEQPWYRDIASVVEEYKKTSRQPDAFARIIAAANRNPTQTGKTLFTTARGILSDSYSPETSSFFKEAGFPGIRYSQGNDRNFVIFDDRIPNIVSRNGRSLADLVGQ